MLPTVAGDLATIVALEDRLTARTNAGEDEPTGNPTNVPSISTYVAGIVGQLAPSQWSQSVIDRLLTFKVGMTLQCEQK